MESSLPLVSIGIPTYNQQQYLQQAIESALAQNYTNLEIVIADDCSTDNTRKIVANYLKDKRVKYFRNERNTGRVLNYRKLFYEYASGDWYVNLDGDDYYTDPYFISRGMELITSNKNKGLNIMFYHSALETKMKDKIIPSVPNISKDVEVISGQEYFIKFFSLNASSHLTVLCNRTKALTINYYSQNTLFTDVHSFLRLALHGYVILDKRMSAVWRFHGKNASASLAQHIKEEISSRRDICDYAAPFVGKTQAAKWFSQAKVQVANDLIYKDVKHDSVSAKDWIQYFKYFRFSSFHMKHFFKYIILSVKDSKPAVA